jgi:hypothetical protein
LCSVARTGGRHAAVTGSPAPGAGPPPRRQPACLAAVPDRFASYSVKLPAADRPHASPAERKPSNPTYL